MSQDSELVYSTDPEQNKLCPTCKKLLISCICARETVNLDIKKISAVIRIEKNHRGGKEVTVIDRLPASEDFLKNLAQLLKKKCGSGGTYKIENSVGIVEIQGIKGELVINELRKMGIKCK